MSWTTPAVRSTGDLITASIWNTDIKDNLRYLKGMDGQITLEDDLIPSGSSLTLGESANPWGAGHLYALYAGPRYTVHRSIREVVINWESDGFSTYQGQLDDEAGGGGAINMGGTGQCVLEVDDDVNGSNASINSCFAAVNNAFSPLFAVSRNPYARFEFALDSLKACQQLFFGFREQSNNSMPGTAENHAGLYMDNQVYFGESSNGSSTTTDPASSPAAAARHVVEVFIISASAVEIWVDGTLECNITTNLPTGNIVFVAMLYSEGTGGVGEHSRLTLGKLIAQEDLN
ncbi:MAG: hypothetical protein M0R06_20895 [Sphaerochaeta sp.]|jgi:hypothetical protein|nr:hypothetical protein [Sphaerochaeta sp.]